jgi:hypothetical protein
MSNVIQETVFPGTGLNWDDDQNLIAPGDSPFRLNIAISGNEASGIITNILGNSLAIDITDHKLSLSQTYTTIASFYNRLTRKCYYWVFSQLYETAPSSGVYIYDNRLMCFNEDTKTLDLIFIDIHNWFGLSLNTTFKDSSMIGDWLYFNPRVSEPKMIDVVRAYNYTNYATHSTASAYLFGEKVTFFGGLFVANASVSAGQTPVTHPTKWDRIGDSYRDESDLVFDSEFEYAFNVLKMPPAISPVLSYGSDTKIQVNNVRGKVFRFSYRYKYFDNTYSAYSAFSDVTLPKYDESYNGEILNDITTNNYIKVFVSAHSPTLIKEVEVVVQESSSATPTVPAAWKRVKIINRQEQAELSTFDFTFNFYNNESYLTVVDTDVTKIMDFVPKRANSMEIINKNILAYGGCLEGFNNIPKEDIRVSLTPVLENISIPTLPGTTRRDNIASGDIHYTTDWTQTPPRFGRYIDMSWAVDGVGLGDQYGFTIDGKSMTHVLTTGEVASKVALINAVATFLTINFHDYLINSTPVADYVYIWSPLGTSHMADITVSLFSEIGATTTSLTKRKGFKTGANHPFCIFYYDENMRRWDAQVSKENLHIFGLEMRGTTVYVPQFNEVSPPPDSLAYRWIIDWEVYHLPPVGARYWRWGYAGNSLCSKTVQYIVTGVSNADQATYGTNLCQIDITPLQTLKTTLTATWNQYPNSVIDPYVWTQGDRVRFITKASVPGAGTDIGDVIDGVYEYEILKYDDAADLLFIQGQLASNGLTAAGVGENSLIEIYTPLKSISDTKTLYYEFGDIMPIVEDSAGIMVHAGQSGLHNQDTALSHTAMGSFDGGDIYHILRTPSKPIDTTTTTKGFFHETMGYSDFYESDDWDKGKIGIETSFGERFLNIVRYSRPFFQNTEINGLSTFEEDDVNDWPGYKEYNDIFGDIVSIYEQGDTLKVYQRRKESSTLIGRQEYMGADGNVTVAVSNTVLGAIRYSPSNYSTVFPESISRNNKFLYGFDIYEGVVWRDGVNGLFPISGRYIEAGGDADYKMQTYFKLKSKALMESGIDHVSVLGVWDEEYKCYYLIFKDSVVQANNETIVFHEPSNRWITFVDMNQTPLNGFNTPLELTYEIVKGFENGIGYSFNEETRFAHFDIGGGLGTSAQTPVFPAALLLRITMPTPRLSCSANVNTVQNLPLTISLPSPLVHVSWIALSRITYDWSASQNGTSAAVTSDVTVVGSPSAWFESIPSWMTISLEGGEPLSLNDIVLDGDTVVFYPATQNSSVSRTGTIVFRDRYGNSGVISVTQEAVVSNPVVILAVHPFEPPSALVIHNYASHGSATTGSNIIDFYTRY